MPSTRDFATGFTIGVSMVVAIVVVWEVIKWITGIIFQHVSIGWTG